MANKPRTERLGVAKLEELFAQCGWLFREQLVEDVGIDAQVEFVQDDIPTGKLIAIQVKSGESYFTEMSAGSIVYRPSTKHVRYWLKYSLPVIVVLCSPSEDALYWSRVQKEVLEETESGVPRQLLFPLLAAHVCHSSPETDAERGHTACCIAFGELHLV